MRNNGKNIFSRDPKTKDSRKVKEKGRLGDNSTRAL